MECEDWPLFFNAGRAVGCFSKVFEPIKDTKGFIASIFFFQAEDGIRDLVRSRGLGDVYKRQSKVRGFGSATIIDEMPLRSALELGNRTHRVVFFLSISAVVYTQRHAIF